MLSACAFAIFFLSDSYIYSFILSVLCELIFSSHFCHRIPNVFGFFGGVDLIYVVFPFSYFCLLLYVILLVVFRIN